MSEPTPIPTTPLTEAEFLRAVDVIERFSLENKFAMHYTIDSLRNRVFQLRHQPALLELKEQYPNAYVVFQGTKITCERFFTTREECVKAVEEMGLNPDDLEISKASSTSSEGVPSTTITYPAPSKMTHKGEEVDVDYLFSYKRAGTPTANCRVVPKVYYEVVCDLPEQPKD